jgi:hypothetical protein
MIALADYNTHLEVVVMLVWPLIDAHLVLTASGTSST